MRYIATLLGLAFLSAAAPAYAGCKMFLLIPSTNPAAPRYIVCDGVAELPSSNVRESDIGYSKDDDKFWKRTAVAWAEIGSGGAVTLAGDVDGDSGATDLDEAAVETELEGVLDLPDLQGTLTIAKGGTGQASATAAFDALAPTTTVGDLIYFDGVDNVRLAAGGSRDFLQAIGGVPAWVDMIPFPVADGGTGAAPGADDQVLVADSTSAATWRSIPDCKDEGETLNYNATSNTFSCLADAGGSGGGLDHPAVMSRISLGF